MQSWLRCLVLGIAFAAFAGCSSYAQWLSAVVAEQPHMADRIEAPHRVAVLDSGRDAFCYRIECVRAAERSIQLQTFIFDDACTTRLLLHELVLAARRGVRVQILTDSMFSAKDPRLAACLCRAHPNFEVRVYNPGTDRLLTGALRSLGVALADFRRINQRMHNKVMVIDGRVGICGGRNYQDSYFDEDLRMNYRDRDIAVTGPVVAEMADSFASYWSFLASVPADKLRDVAGACDELGDDERDWPFTLAELGCADLASRIEVELARGPTLLSWHDVGAVAFWADTPGKPSIDDDPESVALRLIGMLGSARESVWIQSPYLVLSDPAIILLEQVRDRGVTVKVHTNSLASTDNWSSYAHSMRLRRELLEHLRLEVFEAMPYPQNIAQVVPDYDALRQRGAAEAPFLSLHAKSAVIDDELAVIGSYNLDPRSEALNSEVMLAVWDAGFAHELGEAIRLDAAAANSWVVAPKRRSMPVALVTDLVGRVNEIIKGTTTLDLWPVAWSSLFELRPDHEPVSRFDSAFYERYADVGSFPAVDAGLTPVLVRLTKALTGVVRPLM